jgi:single-strand DNA-binding protein
MNIVALTGFLGADGRVVDTQAGGKRLYASLGVDASYKDKDGNWQDRVNWIDIQLSVKSDKLPEMFKKGRGIEVRGELESYQKQIGDQKVSVTVVKVEWFNFTTKAKDKEPEPEQA